MRTILSSLLAAAFVLAASPSMAFNPAHVAQLKLTKKCSTCDLTGANLSSANLRGADLIEANLTGANLSSADLRGADLGYANLTNANLTGANLRGADLGYANLTDANLTSADLSSAFMGANWWRAKYCGTRLPSGEILNRNCGVRRVDNTCQCFNKATIRTACSKWESQTVDIQIINTRYQGIYYFNSGMHDDRRTESRATWITCGHRDRATNKDLRRTTFEVKVSTSGYGSHVCRQIEYELTVCGGRGESLYECRRNPVRLLFLSQSQANQCKLELQAATSELKR